MGRGRGDGAELRAGAGRTGGGSDDGLPPLATSWHGRPHLDRTLPHDDDVDRADRDLRPLPEPVGELPAPLTRSVDVGSLTARPSRRVISRTRRDAAAGRFGDGWNAALDRRSPPPWSLARTAAAVFGGVPVVVALVLALQGDGGGALRALGAGAMAAVAFGAIALALAAAMRAVRWRRHARAAAFAETNGLGLRFTVDAEALPAVVRDEPPADGARVDHTDVLAGSVDGHSLLAGTRTTVTSRHGGTRTTHLVWMAVELEGGAAGVGGDRDGDDDGTLSQAVVARCRAAVADARTRVSVSGGWVLVGVSDDRGDVGGLAVLLAGIDAALAAGEAGDRG